MEALFNICLKKNYESTNFYLLVDWWISWITFEVVKNSYPSQRNGISRGRLVEAGDLTHPFIMTQTTEQVDRILVYQNNNAWIAGSISVSHCWL